MVDDLQGDVTAVTRYRLGDLDRRPTLNRRGCDSTTCSHLATHDGRHVARAAGRNTSRRALWSWTGSGDRVLLTLHKTVDRWLQLGGHCEPGDTTLAGAALREAAEESGLTV